MEIYLVGGAVRDQLLGIPVKERDWVVVGASEEQMLAQGYLRVGKDFPVFLHPKTQEEYALARTERKSGRGYTGFICHATPDVTLEQDLLRRDLTVNAIAQRADGTIIDPFNGQTDLKNKILRHVSPAFQEDPVRVLRLARFSARYHHLGFTIADTTEQLLLQMVRAGELRDLVPERVWAEVEKTLATNNPQQFFTVLRRCGGLAELFPEIDQLFGVPAPQHWHPEIDSGVHTLMVLREAAGLSRDITVRFAALLHDLGKGVTPKEEWPRHIGHDVASVPLVDQLCKRLKAPNEFRELSRLAANLHTQVHQCLQSGPRGILHLLERLDAFRRPERFENILLVCEADSRGRPGHEKLPYPQRDHLLAAYRACKDVDTKKLLEAGYVGEKMKTAVHQDRMEKLKKIISQSDQDSHGSTNH